MARTNSKWETIVGGTAIQTIAPAGYDILINGSNHYINFNTTVGSTGYGIRDNAGTMEFKNSGGSWTAFGSGGGGGTGTVTGIIIATANGFAGTSDGNTATPTLTISTSVTGLLKGNGTAISAAVPNTDYLTPSAAASTYVPYTGATGNVDLGTHTIAANTFYSANSTGGFSVEGAGGAINLLNESGYTGIIGVTGGAGISFKPAGSAPGVVNGWWYMSAIAGATQGGFLAAMDNTYDIGASGANRPRNLFIANSLTVASLSGVLKASSGLVSVAVANTDYQSPISLTTTGTSGAASFISNVLNIPNYTYTLPTATTSVLGGVKVDGTSITISGGVISAAGGGGGTVTSVTSADANATVANTTTTPVITIVAAPKLQTARTISITGDLAYTSPSFDGTGNVTAGGTLATVNTNTGSWGTATQVAQFTVNGKGLVTAAANVTITPAIGSITGLGTGVATFLATPTSANLAAAVTDETGSGALVFGTSPSLTGATLDTTTVGVTQTAGDSSTKLATTAFVANAILGQDFKEAAKYATTGALPSIVYNNGSSGVGATLTGVGFGAISIDSATPSVGDRLLVKNQVSTFQNGIYVVTVVGTVASVFVLTRSADFNQSSEIDTGDTVFVSSGTTLSTTTWAYNGIDAPTIGTTAITFAQTSGQGSFTAGNGIAITGVSIAIDTSITVDKTTAQALTNKNLTSGTNTFPTFNQNTTGSAATLTTPRAINGVNFDGSAAITVTAAAGTLTGTALNSTVVTSSLTSVGTLASLTVTGNITNSALTASKVVFTDASKNLTSTGIGTSAQFIKGDGSLDSSTYITANQTITLSGAVTGTGTTTIVTTFATPGSLSVSSTNSNANAHTHAITSSSAPGAAASLLATDATGIIGTTTTRIVKGWFTDLTVTNAIAGSITGNAATVTTNANLSGVVTSSGNTTSFGTFTSATLATALSDETGTGVAVFGTTPSFTTSMLLSSGFVMNWASSNVVITHSSGILSLGTGELRITLVGTNTASVPTLGSTSTFINKRITKRTGTTTSTATPAINTDNVDYFSITALAVAITGFTMSGTPTDAQTIWISITDNGTGRAITWGTSFEASTVPLPTTTVASARLDVGFIWNTVTSKYRCVAVA